MTKKRQNTKNNKGFAAVLVAILVVVALIAALEFIPTSPFAGQIQRWITEAQQPAQDAVYPGNPANDERSDALQQWLETEQPDVATVEPPSFEPAAEPDDDDSEADVETDGNRMAEADGAAGATAGGSSSSSTSGSSSSSSGSSSGGSTSGNSGSTSSVDGSGSSGSSGNSGTGSSSSGNSNGGSTGGSSSTPSTHTHTLATREVVETTEWIEHVDGHYETVHHAAVYNDWTEPICVCNDCGAVVSDPDEHMISTGPDRCNSWHSEHIYHHDLVSEAWDEEVWVEAHDEVVGYKYTYYTETYCTTCGEVISRVQN